MVGCPVAISGPSCRAIFHCVEWIKMTGSGSGCAFGVICCLNAIIGVVSWPPSCTALFRAARKYCTWCREVKHGGFDFLRNNPGIFSMKEVKDVISIVGQCKTYPEPVGPISLVGQNKEWDFLKKNAVPGTALTLFSCPQPRAE